MYSPELYSEAGREALADEATQASISATGRRAFSDLAPAQEYPEATELFKQGSAGSDVYLVDRGLVKLTALGEAGQELIIGLRTAGRLLGLSSVILQRPYPVSAVTLTRSQARRVPGEILLYVLRNNIQFSRYVHQEISQETYDHVAQLVGLGCMSARCRLERLLVQMVSPAEIGGHKKDIHLPMLLKHWEIAQLIAITPQHLSRVLKKMENDGVLRQEKGRMILTDPSRLCQPPDF